jgi:hypothetical protein
MFPTLVPTPARASWPYLDASIVIHVLYFYFVAISNRGAGLSFVYPIMRGAAPAISAVAVVFVLNAIPLPLWAGREFWLSAPASFSLRQIPGEQTPLGLHRQHLPLLMPV